MKHMLNHPVSAAWAIFTVIFAALMFWISHSSEIQNALRTIQKLIFWWQQ